jgi:hypothetical protein
MHKWYHDPNGNVSTMRILAMWGAVVGTYLIIVGSIAMFLGNSIAGIAMGTGGGLFSLGELAKAFQAQKGL